MQKIRVGIVGYGNIGKGVRLAVDSAPDMELRAIFTRRDPRSLHVADMDVLSTDDAAALRSEIDVMVLCGGSATDLRVQGPQFAAMFNTVDSFDTHAKIPEYLAEIDAAANSTTAIISAGWDPGLFSMVRMLSGAVLPDGSDYTFWGRGVSQGHSDAVRRIEGVRRAVQYTVPISDAVAAVRSGTAPVLTTRQKHLRECFIVADNGADKALIETKIKTMPDYFADYDTTVTFLSDDEFEAGHTGMPHGGMVLRSGRTGENRHIVEFSLKLDSNPEFTGSVMVAYARAAVRMSREGIHGAKTVFDVPLSYLSEKDRTALIKGLL